MCINVHIYLILPVEEYTYSASDADFASLAEVELLPLGGGIKVRQAKKKLPQGMVRDDGVRLDDVFFSRYIHIMNYPPSWEVYWRDDFIHLFWTAGLEGLDSKEPEDFVNHEIWIDLELWE